MGFRTVVMLNNDRTDAWSKDPLLGEKIHQAMHNTHSEQRWGPRSADIGYGRVVECTHADVQTLVRLDHYTGFEPVAYTSRSSGPSNDDDMIRMLKDAADKLGYRLVKKSK
jgi:hypothetical protein